MGTGRTTVRVPIAPRAGGGAQSPSVDRDLLLKPHHADCSQGSRGWCWFPRSMEGGAAPTCESGTSDCLFSASRKRVASVPPHLCLT